MNLNFRKVDPLKDEDILVLMQGMNDPEIQHLVTPNFQEGLLPVVTLEEYRLSILAYHIESHRFIILDGDHPIGDLSMMVDPEYLFLRIPRSGWLGICICDGAYRGKGVGGQALQFIEDFAWEMGLVRIELGVFAYNEPAIRLYLKSGYHEIARIPNFVWYQGRWWADIRMEKLNPSQR